MALKDQIKGLSAYQWVSGKIRNKLLFLLVAVALLPMALLGISMYRSAANGIETQALAQLESIRTVKSKQIEDYFGQIDNQMKTFSQNLAIVDAMKQFPAALSKARAEVEVDEAQMQKMKDSLLGYYRNEFGREYASITGNQPSLKPLITPLDEDSIYLQYQYISNNPNPLGSKETLDAASDGSTYSRLHGKYHPMVRSYLNKFGYYDIFLCDLNSGDIVYSVFKEMDYTTSLKDGPYSKTNFARAFELAANATSPEQTFLVDYKYYTPSYEAPASFISSPVYDGDKKVGVAIFQMPLDKISGILDERTGLGDTGETYAVGPEGLMRNDSRFVQDDPINGPGLVSQGYITKPTTIMNDELKVTTEASVDATAGNTGRKKIADYRGLPVYSSWAPVTIHPGTENVPATTWALMSEIDVQEVFEPLTVQDVVFGSLWVIPVFLVGLGGVAWAANRITRQANSINDMLGSIGIGMFDARAEKITSDELGDVAISLNAMCDTTLSLIQSNDEREEIQNSIESLIGEMENIAAGDLTIDAEVKEDITGSIAGTVNHMTQQLKTLVGRVQNATNQVTTSAGSLANVSNQLSEESDAQANEIGTASERVLEITEQIQLVAEQSEGSATVAKQARETASRGMEAVSNTVEGMDRIREQVQATSKRIKRLGESSQEIGEIVQLISDIADRTSILALNASIQAAMAGDAGQGFAVVAEEVERLAERSTDATKQISTLIKAIQTETSEAITDMEESTREVVEGSELATQAGQTLDEIDKVSQQLEYLITEVSSSATQQANAATEIASTMTRISETTKESADKSRTATQSVGQLTGLANQLRESVAQFKVGEVEAQEFDVLEGISEMNTLMHGATGNLRQMSGDMKPEQMCRLVYTSARSISCDDAEIQKIVATARENNPTQNLTGILLHTNTRFLQVLEGPYGEVLSLYEKIEKDPRHIGSRVRFIEPATKRHFANWGMGAAAITSEEIKAGRDGDRNYYSAMLNGDADLYTDEGMKNLKAFLSDKEAAV